MVVYLYIIHLINKDMKRFYISRNGVRHTQELQSLQDCRNTLNSFVYEDYPDHEYLLSVSEYDTLLKEYNKGLESDDPSFVYFDWEGPGYYSLGDEKGKIGERDWYEHDSNTYRIETEDINVATGLAIREYREYRMLTQQELADKANIKRSALTRIEKGYTGISIGMIEKIALAMRIELETLLG
jgi:DNA-binding XRE family transcriptional regulator